MKPGPLTEGCKSRKLIIYSYAPFHFSCYWITKELMSSVLVIRIQWKEEMRIILNQYKDTGYNAIPYGYECQLLYINMQNQLR